jgi:hypothetical protein
MPDATLICQTDRRIVTPHGNDLFPESNRHWTAAVFGDTLRSGRSVRSRPSWVDAA